MTMKKLLIALTLSLAVFLPRAQAVPDSLPFLGSLRSEVNYQLGQASNALANAVATNNKLEAAKQKKLITLLNTARKTIDKTKTNYVAGSTALGVLNKSLGRSALSNEFNPRITNTFNLYVASLIYLEDLYSDRVDSSYPGSAHVAAGKALDKFLLALNAASTNTNFLLRLKFLAAASKGEALALKATVKAENAPAPPNGLTATVTTSDEGTFTFKPASIFVNAAYVTATKLLNISVIEIKPGGVIQTRSISIVTTVPNEGVNTINLANVICFYSGFRVKATNPSDQTGESYDADSGSMTLTINTTTRLVYGTFNFTGNGDDVSTKTGTVNGSFSLTYLQ